MLLGLEVHNAFPGARNDVKAAGNCYSCGNYTACVFHLTRVLERGLFVLAQDQNLFGMTYPQISPTVTNTVLETWERLIQKIEIPIKSLQQVAPPGGAAQRRIGLDLYSGAAIHFKYFKDHWRNPISHSRANYDQPQAKSTMDKVTEFMRYLVIDLNLKEEPGMILP